MTMTTRRQASRGGHIQAAVLSTMRGYVSRITAQAVLDLSLRRLSLSSEDLERDGPTEALVQQLVRGMSIYLKSPEQRRVCQEALRRVGNGGAFPITPLDHGPRPEEILAVARETDVVTVRRRARELARAVGFDHTTQIKIATSVSELARNIYSYAGDGTITLRRLLRNGGGIEIEARDDGPGIPNLDEILAGHYRSKTGMGLGLRGCKQLMDDFRIDSKPGRGTQVWMVKWHHG